MAISSPETSSGPRRTRSVLDVASVGSALVVLLGVLWPLHRMQFGIVDDHDLIAVAGTDHHLPWSGLFPALTDVHDAPGRVRPVFWLARLTELTLWGPHVQLWYLSRALLACVTLVAIFLVARRYLPAPAAAAVALLPMLGAQDETWMRLAAAECYAMPLLCVGICGVTSARARARGPASVWWAYLALGLAGGAKETFVPVVALVLLAVLVIGWGQMLLRDRVTVLATLAVTAALGAWVAAEVASSGDQYAQERSLSSAADIATFQIAQLDVWWYATAGVIVLVIGGWHLRRRLDRRGQVIGAAIALAVLSQILLYAGAMQFGRYLYPLALLPVAVCLYATSSLSRTTALRRTLGWSAMAVALALPIVVQVPEAHRDAESAVVLTRAFQNDLDRIRSEVRATGVDVVVVQPGDAERDAELVLSLSRYLRDLPVEVMTTEAAGNGTTALDRGLAGDLRTWSERGHGSLVPLDLSQPCLSLLLHDRHEPAPKCPTSLEVL